MKDGKTLALGLVVALLIGIWFGYKTWYLNSDIYKGRIAARFAQLKTGDSYEHMVEVIGRKPTHYCNITVESLHLYGTPDEHYREFIYRIGGNDFVARFPITTISSYGGLKEKKGPVPRQGCAAKWSND